MIDFSELRRRDRRDGVDRSVGGAMRRLLYDNILIQEGYDFYEFRRAMGYLMTTGNLDKSTYHDLFLSTTDHAYVKSEINSDGKVIYVKHKRSRLDSENNKDALLSDDDFFVLEEDEDEFEEAMYKLRKYSGGNKFIVNPVKYVTWIVKKISEDKYIRQKGFADFEEFLEWADGIKYTSWFDSRYDAFKDETIYNKLYIGEFIIERSGREVVLRKLPEEGLVPGCETIYRKTTATSYFIYNEKGKYLIYEVYNNKIDSFYRDYVRINLGTGDTDMLLDTYFFTNTSCGDELFVRKGRIVRFDSGKVICDYEPENFEYVTTPQGLMLISTSWGKFGSEKVYSYDGKLSYDATMEMLFEYAWNKFFCDAVNTNNYFSDTNPEKMMKFEELKALPESNYISIRNKIISLYDKNLIKNLDIIRGMELVHSRLKPHSSKDDFSEYFYVMILSTKEVSLGEKNNIFERKWIEFFIDVVDYLVKKCQAEFDEKLLKCN